MSRQGAYLGEKTSFAQCRRQQRTAIVDSLEDKLSGVRSPSGCLRTQRMLHGVRRRHRPTPARLTRVQGWRRVSLSVKLGPPPRRRGGDLRQAPRGCAPVGAGVLQTVRLSGADLESRSGTAHARNPISTPLVNNSVNFSKRLCMEGLRDGIHTSSASVPL